MSYNPLPADNFAKYKVKQTPNINVFYYMTMTWFYQIRSREHEKSESGLQGKKSYRLRLNLFFLVWTKQKCEFFEWQTTRLKPTADSNIILYEHLNSNKIPLWNCKSKTANLRAKLQQKCYKQKLELLNVFQKLF
jgi:hypothetical protein